MMSNSTKTILGVLVFVAVCAIAIVEDRQTKNAASSAPAPVVEDKRIEAFVMTKRFVKDRLKSPDAADFPNYSTEGVYVTRVSDDLYNVSAFVVSPNSFGVKVRIHYEARMRDKGDGKTWQCVSLTLHP